MGFFTQNLNYFITFSGCSSDLILSSYTFVKFLPHDLHSPKEYLETQAAYCLTSYPRTVTAWKQWNILPNREKQYCTFTLGREHLQKQCQKA